VKTGPLRNPARWSGRSPRPRGHRVQFQPRRAHIRREPDGAREDGEVPTAFPSALRASCAPNSSRSGRPGLTLSSAEPWTSPLVCDGMWLRGKSSTPVRVLFFSGEALRIDPQNRGEIVCREFPPMLAQPIRLSRSGAASLPCPVAAAPRWPWQASHPWLCWLLECLPAFSPADR
jgi:hypothetical protein